MQRGTPELFQARLKAEQDAGREINHIGSSESKGMCDRHHCSCGWSTEWHFDGDVYAHEAWVRHIQEHGAEINYPVATAA